MTPRENAAPEQHLPLHALEFQVLLSLAEGVSHAYDVVQRIEAPFDGYGARILKHIGEPVNEREGIIDLAELDPIEVVLDCPLNRSGNVKMRDTVVLRPLDSRWDERRGEVVLASKVADSASQTFRVRISVPNPDLDWISGLQVHVVLPTE